MLQKAIHIILSVLVFISSTGLVIDAHYCRGELKSIALFAEATPCYQQQEGKKVCPFHAKKSEHEEGEKGCCKDKTQLLKVDDDQLPTSFQIAELEPPVFNAYFFIPQAVDINNPLQATVHYLNYKPPLIVSDRCVQLQRFLC